MNTKFAYVDFTTELQSPPQAEQSPSFGSLEYRESAVSDWSIALCLSLFPIVLRALSTFHSRQGNARRGEPSRATFAVKPLDCGPKLYYGHYGNEYEHEYKCANSSFSSACLTPCLLLCCCFGFVFIFIFAFFFQSFKSIRN